MAIFHSNTYFLLIMMCCISNLHRSFGSALYKRSIDMAAAHALSTDDRLPEDVIPLKYELYLEPNFEESRFSGLIKMDLIWKADSKKIWFHSHFDVNIDDTKIRLYSVNANFSDSIPTIMRGSRLPRKTVYIVYLKEIVKQGTNFILEIPFEGSIWKSAEGLFAGSYGSSNYFTTNLKPNNARRLFPCFDEPGFKVPFNVSIARPDKFVTIFNTPLIKTQKHSAINDYEIDYFEETPRMSPFTFGFVTTRLEKLNGDNMEKLKSENSSLALSPEVRIWTVPDHTNQLEGVHEKVVRTYKLIEDYFGIAVPLKKIDVVFIPELSIMQPVDNWGFLLFKETGFLKNNNYYDLAQELIYQWLGSWITPEWWSEAHLNKALARFIASEIATTIAKDSDGGEKYPMSDLYSLYYELSKRYPHSKITGMKQETVSYKTQLIIRMLNFTLGKDTFQKGIRNFIADHQYKTFIGEDLWEALALQAHKDGTLSVEYKVANIANTWLLNDRLPVVSVRRNYAEKNAILKQNVYLRERPHDAPEKDKMLWWIPIILNRQDNLNFANSTPYLWMEKVQQKVIDNMPESNQFIIVNQEEIAPFPVNYDEQNWNLLANFLQTEAGRTGIPAYTRSKLLHDAWNLAYAGDLSFATALNMTLFMKFERDHIVWNPVFTFIDQIGRHIDVSEIHKKFESYVIALLSPLYKDLDNKTDTEKSWITDLRAMTKRFLCHVGYSPCITEAQNAFKAWQQAVDTNSDSQLPNEYICSTFKWGSLEEWQFGLHRVMHFPKTRPQSERTHLLKTLASCPRESEKINRLLQLSILDDPSNFTENDRFLIITSLTRQSSGYYSLFQFLSENWMQIRQKLENNTNLWDHLIGSATGFFSTQRGYDMVKELYEKRSGEFGSAQHIIEKSLRNIKEEAQWSEENLPVIEKWLNEFLSKN